MSALTRVWTAASGVVRWFDAEGNPEYPCRCGEIHTGPYALYDYAHHECFHRKELHPLDAGTGYYMCPDCGETFHLWHQAFRCPACESPRRRIEPDGESGVATYTCAKGHTWRGPYQPFIPPAHPPEAESPVT